MAIYHPITPRKNTSLQDALSAAEKRAEKRAEDPATVAQKMDDETALLYMDRILEDKMTPVSHCWRQACAQYPVLQKMHNLIVSYSEKITDASAHHRKVVHGLEKEVEGRQHRIEVLNIKYRSLANKMKALQKKKSPAKKKKPAKKK